MALKLRVIAQTIAAIVSIIAAIATAVAAIHQLFRKQPLGEGVL